MLKEIKHKRLIRDRLESLRYSIRVGGVYFPRNFSSFVFLCGANKSKLEVSERRNALMEFAQAHLTHTHFFIAERMFSTLQEEGHKGNLLDVEQLISDFSDYVLIVLESPSSFAELGAFSHQTLRDKLIVINDTKFIHEESFVNLGPIAAIKESAGAGRLIHYKMNSDGVFVKDAIGDTFFDLHKLLGTPLRSRARIANLSALHPGDNFNKHSAMFLHDILYLTGPLLYREIIEVLLKVFGDAKFNNVKHMLAILSAFESIERNKDGLYRSRMRQLYFQYRFDVGPIVATFRNYIQRKYPDRLYAY